MWVTGFSALGSLADFAAGFVRRFEKSAPLKAIVTGDRAGLASAMRSTEAAPNRCTIIASGDPFATETAGSLPARGRRLADAAFWSDNPERGGRP
jgi:hypothetical protein